MGTVDTSTCLADWFEDAFALARWVANRNLPSHMRGRIEAAEDVASEVMRILAKQSPGFNSCPDGGESLWYRVDSGSRTGEKCWVARGALVAYWARKRSWSRGRGQDPPDAGLPDPDGFDPDPLIDAHSNQAVRHCVDRLPEKARTYYFGELAGLTIREISEREGVNPGVVKGARHRARPLLERCLIEQGFEGPGGTG